MDAGSVFQSTPPHGGRLQQPLKAALQTSFNPRPRMGGDLSMAFTLVASIVVSIHAPAWGATAVARPARGWWLCFNPRPRMGGDYGKQSQCGWADGFNPRPRMGGDTNSSNVMAVMLRFQSTPPHGGRQHSEAEQRSQD